MEVNLKDVAGTAEKVISDVMRVEPMIAGAVGMLVPGAAPIVAMVQPEIVMLAPFILRALDQLKMGNNGDALSSVFQMIQHLTAGQPNAPVLSDGTDGLDASKDGSG